MRNTFLSILSIILFFLFPCTFCSGQELPPISNFSSNIYGAGNQNWSISQTENKFIYIANNDGLLEFNGAKWTLFPSPNGTLMRSVAVKDNSVYTGSYMDFGIREKNELGILTYQSLSDKLALDIVEDEQFWNIIPYENWVLFQSLNRIYVYNTLNEEVNIISANNTIHKMYNVEGVIYFQVANEGLYRIQNRVKELVSGLTIFKEDVVVGLFQVSEGLRVITRANGILNFNGKELSSWNTELKSLTKTLSIYTSLRLTDGSLLLGTISNGVYHISKNGALLFKVNQNTGLSDNTALSLFEDDEQHIWIGLDNGVDCINLKAPYTNYIDQSGI
ncbi:MAG: hypothetical protein ACSHW7_12070 [Patiriisocius sp.]|uniref:hypothetical protein n=1 Tax=Patiriisocius sp. TaxID=2822396 RepID=UPI003EFAEB0E